MRATSRYAYSIESLSKVKLPPSPIFKGKWSVFPVDNVENHHEDVRRLDFCSLYVPFGGPWKSANLGYWTWRFARWRTLLRNATAFRCDGRAHWRLCSPIWPAAPGESVGLSTNFGFALKSRDQGSDGRPQPRRSMASTSPVGGHEALNA